MFTIVGQDLRFALRAMTRRPAFTAVVLATLALGIGANSAIFSAVNGILLQPLPFREPERVMKLTLRDPYGTISEPEFMDMRRDVRAFERLAGYTTGSANLTGGAEPERVEIAWVSDGFFQVLGTGPVVGRPFAAEEEKRGGPPVSVISYGLWQRHFGGDRRIVGRTIQLAGSARTVVGVMPPGFDYPSADIALWQPLGLHPDSLWTRNNHYMQAVARLAPGASVERARAELGTLLGRWPRDFPETYFPGKPPVAALDPIADSIVGETRPFLLALAGAAGFVLLIACVNVANLLLARGESRRRELAVRVALGASRARIVRQVLTEGALFAAAGGVLGLLLAWWGGRALLALAPDTLPRLGQVHIDGAVLAFTLGVSALTGLLASLVPALRAARGDSAEVLKEGGKGGAGGSTRAASTRGALVIAEVALAVVTLSGAGLMLRSLWRLQASDLGFEPAGVLTARVSPTVSEYSDERAVRLWRDVIERVAAIPGVRVAAAAGTIPVANEDDSRWSIMVDGRVLKNISEAPSPKPVQVTPNFFRALGIPIVRGRGFTDADREDAPLVAVVNETMARELWPGQDPIGHTIKMFSDQASWATVVGVARDVRSGGFRQDVPATMYFPHAQAAKSALYAPRAMTLVVRTAGDPLAVAPAVRAAVRQLERNAPVTRVRTMEQVVASSIASRRFSTALLAAFAALALALAGIGIYGIIAYAVSQRTFEIGVRMALGAQRGAVMALMLRQGVRLAVIGLAIGLAGALATTRLLRSLLVEVSTVDPLTLAGVALGLMAVALLASVLPARRAMAVSPTEALRGG